MHPDDLFADSAGLEPATGGLTIRCTTIVLRVNIKLVNRNVFSDTRQGITNTLVTETSCINCVHVYCVHVAGTRIELVSHGYEPCDLTIGLARCI